MLDTQIQSKRKIRKDCLQENMIYAPQIDMKSVHVPPGFDKHYIKRIKNYLSNMRDSQYNINYLAQSPLMSIDYQSEMFE